MSVSSWMRTCFGRRISMGCERLRRAEGILKDVFDAFDVVEDGEMGVDGEDVSGVMDVEVHLPSNVIL